MHNRERYFVQYHQRVLATDPIAYWPLNEKQGNVAYDWVSGRVAGAQNGTHVGVTLYQPGIGDGNTAPYYDGANDYTNVYTATLAGAFSGITGSLIVWARVSGAGVWTDGVIRYAVRFLVNAANEIRIWKHSLNNRIVYNYSAGGTTETVTKLGMTTTDFMCIGLTWSAAADQVIAYYNGVQEGAIQTVLGVWAGPLSNTNVVIGAADIMPNNVWDGYIAHCAVWDRALAPTEIADLAVVE